MNQGEKCSQCLLKFTIINPPRTMPTCEHNICTACLKQAIQNRQQFIDCQYCAKKIKRKQIKLFPKNIKLIQKIKVNNAAYSNMSQQKLSFPKTPSPNKSMDIKNQCKQEDELLICSQQSTSIQNDLGKQQCSIHHKPLDIICATDKTRVCSHCAIFGNHKDHRFRTLMEFQNEINEKTLHFSSIISKKQVHHFVIQTQIIEKQQNLRNIKLHINLKLQARKQILSKQIQKSFQALIDSIKNQKRLVQRQMQQNFDLTLNKISQSLSGQPKLKKNYHHWQRSCQDTINKLRMTRTPQNRVDIYYDSPLQICQQGEIYLQQMVKVLRKYSKQNQEKINSISIKIDEIPINNYINLVFPLLQENSLSKQLAKIQQSFEYDIQTLKNNLQTKQDLNQNSFIFDPQISSIHFQQSCFQSQQKKNKQSKKLNRSVTSINSFNSITNLPLFNKTIMSPPSNKNKLVNSRNQQKQREKHISALKITKIRSNPKRFGSPDFTKTSLSSKIFKRIKSPQEILIQLATNDFINQVDLSDLCLSDKQIKSFIVKAKQIRPLKAIKLQKNCLTDEGFESICEHLEHVFNLNLSHNNLTNKSLQIILKNKEYLYKMRIINFSNNKITTDRTDNRIKGKLQQIRKIGLMVTL